MAQVSKAERIASKLASFKNAIETDKTVAERDLLSRLNRYDTVVDRAANHHPVLLGALADREEQGLVAKCKSWSTDDFESKRVLGQGAFGTVHLVRQKGTDNYFALKQMKKAPYATRKNYRDRVYAERNILAEADSRWFVRLHMAFMDSKYIYMLMDFLQGGDLIFHLQRRQRFCVETTRFYMAELLLALDAVHRLGFIHRDVKPDNIVLDSKGHLQLLDFGLCKHCGGRDEQSPAAKAAVEHCGLAMKLHIVDMAGRLQMELDVDPNTETVLSLQVRIEAELNMPIDTQKLYLDKMSADAEPVVAKDAKKPYLDKAEELLDPDQKLADWGVQDRSAPVMVLLARENMPQAGPEGHVRQRSKVGTPQYMAPEVFEGVYGPAVDIWAVGIMTFECLVGHVPFYSSGQEQGAEMFRAVSSKVRNFERYLPRQLNRGKEKGLLNPVTLEFLEKVLARADTRANVAACKAAAFFMGVDFGTLHTMKAKIVPDVTDPSDASYFDDDFEQRPLPRPEPGRRDADMMWSHFEYDRTTQTFNSADIDVERLGQRPVQGVTVASDGSWN